MCPPYLRPNMAVESSDKSFADINKKVSDNLFKIIGIKGFTPSEAKIATAGYAKV